MATINYIPLSNISSQSAGLKWSKDAAEKARQKAAFIRVKNGPQATSKRFLSGAGRSWSKGEDSNIIFDLEHRIAGTREDIQAALAAAKISQDEINAAINNAITIDNYLSEGKNAYDAELNNRQKVKDTSSTSSAYAWDNIILFGQNIEKARIENKNGMIKSTVSKSSRNLGEAVAEKVKNLEEGKVLDVSTMDVNTGKGSRIITPPKTDKSGKFGARELKIVSSDFDNYVRALELVYGEMNNPVIQKAIQDFSDKLAATKKVDTNMPPPVPMFNNRTLPGATLAQPPTFTSVQQNLPTIPSISNQNNQNTVPLVRSPGVRQNNARVPSIGGNNYQNIPSFSQ